MHIKTALFGLNFDAFEYSWDETGGATRIGLALLLKYQIFTLLLCVSSVCYCYFGNWILNDFYDQFNSHSAAVAQWLERSPHKLEDVGYTKNVIKMVSDASLHNAQHIRIGLANPLKSRSKNEMDSIRNERSKVINISLNNLFRNQS